MQPAESAKDAASAHAKVNYLRDWIYGGIDGAVTTFAIVAGVVGADLSAGIVVVLGLANVFADGFSMAASNYSGTKAERDDYTRLDALVRERMERDPAGQVALVRQLMAGKGFSGAQLDEMVALITGKPDVWRETVLAEQYGLSPVRRSPRIAAAATFAAFLVCGLIPLGPFMFGMEASALAASIATGLVFLVIGAVKSHWSTQKWWWSAAETFLIGMTAAGIAYGAGSLLRQFVSV